MTFLQPIRAYSIEISLIAALLAAIGFFAYLGYGLVDPATANPTFSGQQAMMHLNQQIGYGPRFTGSPGNEATGDWLIEELGQLGWSVYIQPFQVTEAEIPARNILAVRGTGPTVMLTANYDSRLYADQDSVAARRSEPMLGANDNASGVAVLLELARTLEVNQGGHEVCLVFLDAGNNGGIPGWDANMGGRYFVDQIDSLPRCAQPEFAVSVNGVGDMDQTIVRPQTGDRALIDALWQVANALGYTQWTMDAPSPVEDVPPNPFERAGIPFAEVTDPVYRHRATLADTADRVSAEALQRVGRTLELWLEEGAVLNRE